MSYLKSTVKYETRRHPVRYTHIRVFGHVVAAATSEVA